MNTKPKRDPGCSPEDAYRQELTHLRALPAVLPPVYEVLDRVVDLYGFVSVDTNRYSVPERLVGKTVTVYKHYAEIDIQHRGASVAVHPRLIGQRDVRHTLAGHHTAPQRAPREPVLEQELLRGAHDVLLRYVGALKQRHHHGRGVRALRRLLQIKRTYPREPFEAAVQQALKFGLFDPARTPPGVPHRAGALAVAVDDRLVPLRAAAGREQGADLARLEHLVLRHVAGDFFALGGDDGDGDDDPA